MYFFFCSIGTSCNCECDQRLLCGLATITETGIGRNDGSQREVVLTKSLWASAWDAASLELTMTSLCNFYLEKFSENLPDKVSWLRSYFHQSIPYQIRKLPLCSSQNGEVRFGDLEECNDPIFIFASYQWYTDFLSKPDSRFQRNVFPFYRNNYYFSPVK